MVPPFVVVGPTTHKDDVKTMPSFYTRSGDDGYTGLLGEGRVPKYHPRPEANGVLDEATAALGLARALSQEAGSQAILVEVQRNLYHVMAEVAANRENAARFRVISSEHVVRLEQTIDALSEQVNIPKEFILPGDSPAGAAFALARTVIRRAERHLVRLMHAGELENEELVRYVNRLSSLCFVLELIENQHYGHDNPTLAKG